MKNFKLILVMLLVVATASGQTSRRETKNEAPARNKEIRTNSPATDKSQSARQTARISEDHKYRPSEHQVKRTANPIENRRESRFDDYAYRNSNHAAYSPNRKFNGGREVAYHYPTPPRSREYRRVYAPYRAPVHFNFYWTPEIRFEYIRLYPVIGYNKYPVGFRFENISAYDALYYKGEIANVYGKVFEVYYSRSTDEYILYFGAYYPYHDFTAIVPGEIARLYSPWPERYFAKEHMIITGLITMFEGVPEIAVRSHGQIRLY
jgi:hypothetical protein